VRSELRAVETPQPVSARRDVRPRCGLILVELILAFPLFVALLAAVIQFGLIFAVNQQASYASRFGAKLASEEGRTTLNDLNLASGGSGGVSRLRSAINDYLSNAGLATGACTVILQHNTSLGNQSQADSSGSSCNCGPTGATLPSPVPPASEYVRVTVCVPLAGNVPNLLSGVGFSVSLYTLQHSTTFRYESI
jgi:hypothetical protein